MLEHWNNGMLEYWNIGVMKIRSIRSLSLPKDKHKTQNPEPGTQNPEPACLPGCRRGLEVSAWEKN